MIGKYSFSDTDEYVTDILYPWKHLYFCTYYSRDIATSVAEFLCW